MRLFRRRKKEVKEQAPSTYLNFPYHAGQLTLFLAGEYFFTLCLKDGTIIHYAPDDRHAFHNWLLANKVSNILSRHGYRQLIEEKRMW